MTKERPAEAAATTAETGGFRVNEDWAATVIGLLLVALVLAGIIGKGIVP